MKETPFNPTTPIWFYAKTTTYVVGEGETETWALIISTPLYCEWRGGFGERAVEAAALGVNDFATVRTFYHPDVLAAMRTSRVIIVKNFVTDALKNSIPNATNTNVYELWGAADNVREENRAMEFRVRRFEGL